MEQNENVQKIAAFGEAKYAKVIGLKIQPLNLHKFLRAINHTSFLPRKFISSHQAYLKGFNPHQWSQFSLSNPPVVSCAISLKLWWHRRITKWTKFTVLSG